MELSKTHFPYCIQKAADGYILLNRNYKPLGVTSGEWVDYDTHPTVVRIKITPALAEQLSWNGSTDTERVYLYNDGTNPRDGQANRNAYLKRLDVLMSLNVEKPTR